MAEFAPALPHGPLTEVFPDVFVVRGTFRFAPGLSITRNMTILRRDRELTLVNSVRLSPAGQAELAGLGEVKHLVRQGAFHSQDDAWFVDRYRPAFWAPPGTRHRHGLQHTHDLVPGQSPRPDLSVFAFSGKRPEVALVLAHDGGVLLTCDCYQNWTTFEGCSLLGKIMMRVMGFGPTLIGGPWLGEMGPAVRPDFDRLLDLPFRHLLSAHGTPLRDTAKEGLRKAIATRFR